MKYKKVMAACLITVLVGLTGCSSGKTLEEQVTENLLRSENIPDVRISETQIVSRPDIRPEADLEVQAEEETKEAAHEQVTEEDGTEAAPQAAEEAAEEKTEEPADDTKMQIVFIGDSIFDTYRDGTGVPYLVGEACDANIYNLSIGGTTAALLKDEPMEYEKWESAGLLGIVHAINGHISPDLFDKYYAKKVFETCDFSKTDYFVLEYGSNDFFSQIPIAKQEGVTNDFYCYYGAVEFGVSELKNAFPDATVIFVTPHYEQFWGKNNVMLGDCNTLDLGCGTLSDYIAAGYDAALHADAYCINAYDEMGINGYSAEEYLEDGVHLSEAGRRVYAERLARIINNIEINKAN